MVRETNSGASVMARRLVYLSSISSLPSMVAHKIVDARELSVPQRVMRANIFQCRSDDAAAGLSLQQTGLKRAR